MTWKSVRRSIRGRVWVWHSYGWCVLPWLGVDEYYRRTLVLPCGRKGLVIALWESLPAEFDPYQTDPVWARWKSVRRFGRIER